MTWGIIATIALILINGFFVAAEFALVKVRGTLVDIKANQGDVYAKDVQHIQHNLDKYLSAMQLGITLASLALGWIGEEVMTHIVMELMALVGLSLSQAVASSIAVPIAFIAITMFHIIIGEQLPKYIAIGNPLGTSLKTARLLRWFYRLFSPFIWLLHKTSALTARLVGVEPNLEENAHNEEEIRMMLVESEEEGYINPSSHELIQNVFSFDDRQVRHIYTPKHHVVGIDTTQPIEVIIQTIVQEGYSRYPVYEGNFEQIKGILYVKDSMPYLVDNTCTKEVLEKILRPYYVVPLVQSIESLLHDMQRMHNHIAVVQNEYGEMIGIVSMEDIIEELIGDVQDETDAEQQPYTVLDDGTRVVQGDTTVSLLQDVLPEPLPENDAYATLGGYIVHCRGRIPVVGEIVTDDVYEYHITAIKKHTIQTVRIVYTKNTDVVVGEKPNL